MNHGKMPDRAVDFAEGRRKPSSGIVPRHDGSCDLLLEGRWVGYGSRAAMEAAARLFGLDTVGCVTPNGRTDSHGVYVEFREGRTCCAFCHQPLEGERE